MNTDVKEAQKLLNANGFPAGVPDGIAGPKTRAALLRFQQAHAIIGLELTSRLDAATAYALEQLPQLSPNFTVDELRSKGNGNCYVARELLWALEVYRAWIGKPLYLVSAFRDPAHNRSVGGARRSLHVAGAAVDHSRGYRLHVDEVKELELFSGLGYRYDTGFVVHADVRHRVGRGYSPQKPSTWKYR